MSNFAPTPEQSAALDAFRTGEDEVLTARAGAGKTSTLKLMANDTTRKGIYFAYNRAIADEAKADFPKNVNARTGHSLAFMSHGKPMKHKLDADNMLPSDIARHLGITKTIDLGEDTRPLDPWTLGRLVKEGVGRFCYTADRFPALRHTPYVESLSNKQMMDLASFLLPHMNTMWEDNMNPNGILPFTHDCYLKMWQLSRPNLRADFIMLDEAQDANPVIMDVLERQDAQVVLVGDAAQQIYAWRGAVDAMTEYDADWRLPLTQSFRFGPAIAEEANRWLDILEAGLPIEGAGPESEIRELDMGEEDVVICRTNGAACSEVITNQLLGKRVALVGDPRGMARQVSAAGDLLYKGRTNHPEFVAFKDWDTLKKYVEETGGPLKTVVSLVERYGAVKVEQALRQVVPENEADITVTTAHRSKGRQWDNVRIANDFQAPGGDDNGVLLADAVSRPEAMLAYVAITRAKKVLDRGSLAWIDGMEPGERGALNWEEDEA